MMESSSVSQESLDRDDYELLTRRSRIKTMRGRSSSHKESVDSGDLDHGGTVEWGPGDGGTEWGPGENETPPVLAGACSHLEHDSPTRARILKEKRGRANHLHKNRQDKRRLREKRRSTGVVHMPSTESTGDSLTEDDADKETRRNTTINEGSQDDSPIHNRVNNDWHAARNIRSKSPSDLEADLEDNQDYDSTASHSETNLTLIGGQLSSILRTRGAVGGHGNSGTSSHHHHPHYHHHHFQDSLSSRPLSYPSRIRHHMPPVDRSGLGTASGPAVGTGVGMPGDSGVHSPYNNRTGTGSPITGTHQSNRSAVDNALQARIRELEQELEKQKTMVEERDHKICQLEKQITMMHQDLEVSDAEIERLQAESRTLIRAMASLTM